MASVWKPLMSADGWLPWCLNAALASLVYKFSLFDFSFMHGAPFSTIATSLKNRKFMDQMKDRIRQIQDYAKLSQQDFSGFIGISPATLSGVYAGRTQASNKLVTAIHSAFPEINIYWLMFGSGNMFVEGSNVAESAPESTSDQAPVQPQPSSPSSEGTGVGTTSQQEADIAGVSASFDGPLFQMQPEPTQHAPYASRRDSVSGGRSNMAFQNSGKNIYKPVRRIKEIRVFFDDGTYESFVPSSK